MAIPASQIVAIYPRLINAGGTDLEFNGLLLSKNTLIPLSSSVMVFASADAVGDYFGVNSDEYSASVEYFNGYDNSFSKPRHIVIARRVSENVGAYIRGGKYNGVLADLKAITSGDLTINIDGSDIAVSSVDFSACTSFSDVASILQTALQSELASTTVTYSSLTKAFTINSPTAGENSTIAYGTGSLATAMNFTLESGAVLSQGMNAMTPNANMQAIKEITQNWVTFTTIYAADNTEVMGLSKWASDQKTEYCYVGWVADPLLLVQGSTTSIADIVEESKQGATHLTYDKLEEAVFVLGTFASINWERYNGTITAAFKKISGVSASVTNQTDADLLLAKKVSFMGNFATRNDEFTFYYDGKMFGDYGYLDTFINTIWLKNVMQLSILNGLTQAGRVPYNEDGYALIRAWLQDPINRALNNGTIDTGLVLSESQKAQIMRETGKDLSTELNTVGYAILIEDAGASVRVGRQSPNISVYYTYAGSVHRVEVASTAII